MVSLSNHEDRWWGGAKRAGSRRARQIFPLTQLRLRGFAPKPSPFETPPAAAPQGEEELQEPRCTPRSGEGIAWRRAAATGLQIASAA